MSDSLEELKSIIDNAPDGKTHVCVENNYYEYWNDDDCDCLAISGDGVYLSDMRSLSDIKLIIELEERKIEANLNHQSMLGAYLND